MAIRTALLELQARLIELSESERVLAENYKSMGLTAMYETHDAMSRAYANAAQTAQLRISSLTRQSPSVSVAELQRHLGGTYEESSSLYNFLLTRGWTPPHF